MNREMIVALISSLSNIVSIFVGIQLIKYRVEQLEKKVEKNNQIIDRVYHLESDRDINKEQHKVFNDRITDLEEAIK